MIEFANKEAIKDAAGNAIAINAASKPNRWAIEALTPEQEAEVNSQQQASLAMLLVSIGSSALFDRLV